MFRTIASIITVAVLVPIVGCGASSTAAPATPTATATASATPSATAAAASPAASGTGAANAATRVTGSVQTVAGNKVTLTDGSSFNLAPTARVIRQSTITSADLKPGQFVAVTAKRQPDNTLLASIVSVFSDSVSKAVPAGQRPLPEGNLMTNAAIDSVTGNSFTVSFSGGGAKVTLAPDAQVLKQTDASIADVRVGVKVSAGVVDGTAQSVVIQ